MNSAVPFAGRTRHDGDPGGQHVLADELEVSMTSAEQAREFILEPGVDALEGLLEARARLTIDAAHRLIEGREGIGEIGELTVEIFLALGVLLELVDRSEVDLAELLEIRAQLGERLLPLRHVRFGRESLADLSEIELRR